jgi:hypothetical protein
MVNFKLLFRKALHKPITINYASLELGLYDSQSGKSIKAYKIIDATHLLENNDNRRCVIKYANCLRGKIAQICYWYEPTKDLGAMVHYFINEITDKELAKDEVFYLRCELMNVNPFMLARFIYENQYYYSL